MIAPKYEPNPWENPIKVLHLEDSDADHHLLKRAIRDSGLDSTVLRAETKDELLALLERHAFDIVLMDYRLLGFTALDAWDAISKRPDPPPCVIVSGAIGESAAVSAIQMGISDYLHKDNLQEIGRVVLRALRLHEANRQREQAVADLLVSERKITALAHHLQTSLEQERAEISREIHDDIGGALAAIRLDVAWLARHADTEAQKSHATAAQEMVGQALIATQRIMQNTRPAILDQGLGPSVHWLVSAHRRRTGQKVTLDCRLDLTPLPDTVRLTAYRIVQESLTNISKYAPAAEVKIDISNEGGVLTAEITDSGPGFDVTTLSQATGFGLKGLSERARSIGGWLDISSTPDWGTSINMTAPLANTATTPQHEEHP